MLRTVLQSTPATRRERLCHSSSTAAGRLPSRSVVCPWDRGRRAFEKYAGRPPVRVRLDRRPRLPVRRRRQKKLGRDRGQDEQALGRGRGGFGTKIHGSFDGLEHPAELKRTWANESDIAHAEALLSDHAPEVVVADRGCDRKALADEIEARGSSRRSGTLCAITSRSSVIISGKVPATRWIGAMLADPILIAGSMWGPAGSPRTKSAGGNVRLRG